MRIHLQYRCIDIERNLDLRNTSSCWRESIQTELAKGLVVLCELSLTLYDVDVYSGLVVCCGGEYLALLGRDRGVSSISFVATPPRVSMDRDSGVTSSSRISPAPASPASLPPWIEAPSRHALVRVQGLARLIAGQLFYLLTCRTAAYGWIRRPAVPWKGLGCVDPHLSVRSVPELRFALPGRGSARRIWLGQIHLKVLRASLVCGDERKVDVGRCGGGQLLLCLLCRFS